MVSAWGVHLWCPFVLPEGAIAAQHGAADTAVAVKSSAAGTAQVARDTGKIIYEKKWVVHYSVVAQRVYSSLR